MGDVNLNGSTYFFKERDPRLNPRRNKKNLDDIPPGLKYSHLKTKANTTSGASTKSGEDLTDGGSEVFTQVDTAEENQRAKESFDIPIGHQTDSKVAFTDSIITNLPGDRQRLAFENYKTLAQFILVRLGAVFDHIISKKIVVKLPKTVRALLHQKYKDLSSDAIYSVREWQTWNSKHSWDADIRKREAGDDSKSNFDSTTISSDVFDRPPSIMKDKVPDSGRSSAQPPVSVLRSKSKGKMPPSQNRLGLGNICEDDERASRMERSRAGSVASQHPSVRKVRGEKFKPMLDQVSRTSFNRGGEDGTISIRTGDVTEDSANAVKGYYVSVIQFALSSRICEEKGWIVHNAAGTDVEPHTVLEWARQRLQTSIKLKNEQDSRDRELGLDKTPEIIFYGEPVKKERIRPKTSPDILVHGICPDIPYLGDSESDQMAKQQVLSATITDGSTTVYYPSGTLALVTSHAGAGRNGHYMLVYDDNMSHSMLASFTPTGRGACYHHNGLLRLLSTDTEIILYDENGMCQKRSTWPRTSNGRLPATLQIRLNQNIVFRCMSRNTIYITYTHQKHMLKFPLMHALQMDPDNLDQGKFLSGTTFTSHSAKEIAKQYRLRMKAGDGKKDKKSKKNKNVTTDGQTKPTSQEEESKSEEEASKLSKHESDTDLHRISRRIKSLISDWMLHYRTTIGSTSLPARADPGHKRSRSAKSSPSDILRELNMQPRCRVRAGVSSAPSSRDIRPLTATSKLSPSRPTTKQDTRLELPAALNIQSPSKSPRYLQSGSTTRATPGVEDRPRRAVCPRALCRQLMGEDDSNCRCTKHRLPSITDVEYDLFIQHCVPDRQMIIVCVVSSRYPGSDSGQEAMLEQMYTVTNRDRIAPCLQSIMDAFRLFRYDVATATEYSDHTQPLLMWRHNVVPGMILMYQNGKLLFCDHIFNGYGNARKDFTKQVLKTRREANAVGSSLPDDFRFSPQMGRRGPRSAWGGEIGGAGVDRYAHPGLEARHSYLHLRTNSSSSLSSESTLRKHVFFNDRSLTTENWLSSVYQSDLPISQINPISGPQSDPPRKPSLQAR